MPPRTAAALAVLTLALAACSDPPAQPAQPSQQAQALAPGQAAPPAGVAADPAALPNAQAPMAGGVPVLSVPAPSTVPPSASPIAQAIDAAGLDEAPPPGPAPGPAAKPAAPAKGAATAAKAAKTIAERNRLIRAEVLLDRAHFSPGVIDGQGGTNLKLALSAYQAAHGLPQSGKLDAATFAALTAADAGPAMQDYVITADDVAGPFTPPFDAADYPAMAKLPHLGYATPREALAERFHMDEGLLGALNPGADFAKAGTSIVVTAPRSGKLAAVSDIEVDKSLGEVRAYDDKHVLLAVYPATVGSTERPAPSGDWAVRAVAPHPTYTFDPTRLTFGKVKTKLTIAAGPNNPVGGTWIDLTKDTYGIHGTPDPRLVNKRASHGCVRLTNWDVAELGAAVKKGAKVSFVGVETRAKT